jgi:sodium/hydrogen antiporter
VIVEDEHGEVVKTYQLQAEKVDGTDLVSQSLKYMGMGGLAKQKSPEEPAPASEPSNVMTKMTSRTIWGGLGMRGPVDPSVQRDRKKSVAEEKEEEDDRHIRFTIDGVGQRLTKEDFIKKMQSLDDKTRHEVVDMSSASHTVKTIAKQDPVRRDVTSLRPPLEHDGSSMTTRSDESGVRSRSYSPIRGLGEPSRAGGEPESAVERRRRLAALRSQGDEDVGETPAERRRREAALGALADDDSDDEGTERVPHTRKGIRFADVPERGRK